MSARFAALASCLVWVGCTENASDSSILKHTGGGGSQATSTAVPSAEVPLMGASIEPLSNGLLAVAATDLDQVVVLKPAQTAQQTPSVVARLQLAPGSRATRIAAMTSGEFAVVLRGTGEVVTVGPNALVLQRFSVCPEPRGVAFDSLSKSVVVACAGGELVTIGADSSMSTSVLDEELRDVLVIGETTFVTTFRSAELLELDARHLVVNRLKPPGASSGALTFRPHLAWRTIVSGQRIIMAHQLELDQDVGTLATSSAAPSSTTPVPKYYGSTSQLGTCLTSVVSSAVTAFDATTHSVIWSGPIAGSLPLDVAADATSVYVLSAGTHLVLSMPVSGGPSAANCSGTTELTTADEPFGLAATTTGPLALTSQALHTATGTKELGLVREANPARVLFHTQSSSGVACASCHAEGYDDGHIWVFSGQQVRTQSLEGGLLDTAPFHWRGELPDIAAVLHTTLEVRMGGALPKDLPPIAFAKWLDRIPQRLAPATRDVSHGKQLFTSAGCDACHSGAAFTNNRTLDVGTGGAYQVPSLRALKFRGPWMHDGCAQRLEDRFTPACGGTHHAVVDPGDVPDLVAYLQTL